MRITAALKTVVRDQLARHGFELRREPTFASFLRSRDVDMIVDVGANIGQFATLLRARRYQGRIWSFEPTADAFNILESKARHDKSWQATRTALGETAGTVAINVATKSEYSSIRAASSVGHSYDVGIATATAETVPVTTLDAMLSNDPAQAIFVKIDTQGYEREVLLGGRETLKRAVGLLLELPVEQLYEGVWSFHEAMAFVADFGFEPAQIRMVNPRHTDWHSAVEFDCVFRRR